MSDLSLEFGYITGIELMNIRAFKRLRIDLSCKNGPRMLSVIIGRNGTCKSTLLRSIALGLCHKSDAGALLAESGGHMVSENAKSGYIKLEMADNSRKEMGEIRLIIKNKNGREIILNRETSVPDVDFFVCGYGPNRGNTGSSRIRDDYRVLDSVSTLFDYRQSLVDIELMLRRLEDFMGTKKYNRAKKGIKRVLGLGPEQRIHYAKGGGVKVSGPGIGKDIPLDGWADGYRMTFNWLIDLYGWAMQADAVTKSGGVRGILLIDEIDQNLHPTMQSILLNELSEALPEIQVFATTHSPVTALGTESENVIALHRKGSIIKVAAVPSLMGYSADDVLVEEALFGTDPYPQYTRRKLDRHRKLAAIPVEKRTKEQEDEVGKLTAELDPGKLPTLRDDPVAKKLDEITQLLKKEQKS